jgi:hypothetical protein
VSDGISRLSPAAAVAIGLALSTLGLFAIALSLGIPGPLSSIDTPPWVGVCIGLVFLLGGLALIVGYAVAGGVGPDGDLPAGTPPIVRAVQYVLGLGILIALGMIGSWVAFGPGPRQFTGRGALGHGTVNETLGRVAFGFGAVLRWIIVGVMCVIGVRRLRRR